MEKRELRKILGTKLKLLESIYAEQGIHVRALSRKLNLGIPSIKYGLNKLISEGLVKSKKEGRNLKFYINYNNKLIIPRLYNIEYCRFLELPKHVQDAVFDVLKILNPKPIITLIFGSYAKDNFIRNSDLDIFLVFNRADKKIESKISLISSRHNIKIEPVYLTWGEFYTKFFNNKDRFMREIKNNRIIIQGIEWFVMLENEAD